MSSDRSCRTARCKDAGVATAAAAGMRLQVMLASDAGHIPCDSRSTLCDSLHRLSYGKPVFSGCTVIFVRLALGDTSWHLAIHFVRLSAFNKQW